MEKKSHLQIKKTNTSLKIYYFVCNVSKAVHHMVFKELNLLLSHIFIYLCIIFHNLAI